MIKATKQEGIARVTIQMKLLEYYCITTICFTTIYFTTICFTTKLYQESSITLYYS